MQQQIVLHELILAIIVVLILVLLLIITVLAYSFYSYRILHHRQSWTQIIELKIMTAIVGGDDLNDPEFKSYLREPSFRTLFLHLLVNSDRKFSGAAKQSIGKLFMDFKLEDEAWRKLRQRKAYLIAGGIQELAAMSVEPAIPVISTKLHDPRPSIYQEAQYALVSFQGFEGLRFLDNFDRPLSDWQQLRLLYSIHVIPETSEQYITLWLNSSNSSVIIFSLRLIRKFRLLVFNAPVQNLLEHPKIDVRVQAVRTLQAIENDTTLGRLTKIFDEQFVEVQLEILKAMKISKSRDCENFLKAQLWNSRETSIKITAAEVLVVIGQEEYLREIALTEATTAPLKQIIDHALQEKKC